MTSPSQAASSAGRRTEIASAPSEPQGRAGARARRPAGRARRWWDSRTPILGPRRAVSSVPMRLPRRRSRRARRASLARRGSCTASTRRRPRRARDRGPHRGPSTAGPSGTPSSLGLRAARSTTRRGGGEARWTPPASRSSATASSPATGTGARPRRAARGLLDHQVGDQRAGRHRGPGRRPAPRRPRRRRYVPQWRGTASETRHRAQPALQRQRPLLVAPVGLRRPARGAQPHERTPSGCPSSTPPARAWAYNNAAIQVLEPVLEEATGMPVATVRAGAAVRAARHDPLDLHHRPGRRRGGLLRPADHLPRPRPLRLALPRRGAGRRHAACSTRATCGARSAGRRPRTTRPTATCGGSTARARCAARPTRSTRRASRSARSPASWRRPRPADCTPPSASAARCCWSTRRRGRW